MASMGEGAETTVYDHPRSPINLVRFLLHTSAPPPFPCAEHTRTSRTVHAKMKASQTLGAAPHSSGTRRVAFLSKVHRSTAGGSHSSPDAVGHLHSRALAWERNRNRRERWSKGNSSHCG